MSRARNLKPAFFKNEDLAELAYEFRILFQGLWCLADREGRLENRPKRIKAELFPYDDVDVVAGLDQLAARGFIDTYAVNDSQYIQVVEFSKHQNPHCKEAESTIPAQCKPGASPADPLNPLIDPPTPIPGGARSSTADLLEAYHRILPRCQSIAVLNDRRRKRIAAAVKLAKQVCAEQGWPYDAPQFWHAYFTECASDAWMRGEVPNPKNAAWVQNLDVLLAEDRFASVMDRAIAAARSNA